VTSGTDLKLAPSAQAPATLDVSVELMRRPRVGFYSHDAIGLGSLAAELAVVNALASPPLHAIPLLVAGEREATAFAMPPGTECLTPPVLRKSSTEQYQARTLDVSISDIVAVRERVIRAALVAFEPDVLMVDNVPRGALRELESTLQQLRKPDLHRWSRCDPGHCDCGTSRRDRDDEVEVCRVPDSNISEPDILDVFSQVLVARTLSIIEC
jgi:hypothetical protein